MRNPEAEIAALRNEAEEYDKAADMWTRRGDHGTARSFLRAAVKCRLLAHKKRARWLAEQQIAGEGI